MKIAVAGGTGSVGAHVVETARERGHEVVVLTRGNGVDLVSGVGLDTSLDGVDTVIDVASITTLRAEEAVAFFSAVTRNLRDAEASAGVGHHVALSIVGIDGATEGYYVGKQAQERLVEASTVPWTILRATQFHEFAPQMFANAKLGPLHLAPKMRTQPIAAREVAERLVELAEVGPSGRVTDLAGPREESLSDMVKAYARAKGYRGWIPAIALPGETGRRQRDGSALPGAGAQLGRETFAEWLAAQS